MCGQLQPTEAPRYNSFAETVMRVIHARRQGASDAIIAAIIEQGPPDMLQIVQRVMMEAERMQINHRLVADQTNSYRVYKATQAELAPFGVSSVEEMVWQFNAHLRRTKENPVFVGYPTNRAAFKRLAFRWRCFGP